MGSLYSKNKAVSRLIGGFIGLSLASAGALAAGTLGELNAQGAVQISGGVSHQAPFSVTDKTYALFSGDTISTGQGSAVVSVFPIGKIGLAKDSVARLSGAGSSLEVALQRGAVLYSVKPGSDLSIQAGGLSLRPAAANIRKVAADGGLDNYTGFVSGWVSVDKDGLVKVSANTGSVQVMRGGQIMNVVDRGQSMAFRGEGGRFVKVQAEAITGSAVGGGLFTTGMIVMGAIGLTAGGVMIANATSGGGGGGQNRPASP
jgi:hypothetical protein